MQLLISIKIGLVPISADLSNGRLHILSTPETTTRDASVTILAMAPTTVHKQTLKKNPKRRSSQNKRNNLRRRKNLKRRKNRKRRENRKRRNKRVKVNPNFQTSAILLKNSKRFGRILTSQKKTHPGPCTKSIALSTTSSRNWRKSTPSSCSKDSFDKLRE